jgi:CubicO group peptidase (beta-lactamase class C family)
VFSAWLAAFNSADRETIQAFDRRHRSEPRDVEQTLGFRRMTGGFTLVRVEKSEPTALSALLQENDSDTVARLEMSVTADDPPRIVRAELLAVPRPADLQLPRLGAAEALAALAARADALAAADQFAGAVLVARHGKPLLQRAWGLADRESQAPATLETQFRLGSMNKMFTAVATLQLVDAGKLALDDPIGKHLTDYPNPDAAAKVTVRHLLTHTGGTGDIFEADWDDVRLTLRTHDDYLAKYGARPPLHAPGARWEYSNFGFVLLGAIIERVTNKTYYEAVAELVYAPAGMTETSEPIWNERTGAIGYTSIHGTLEPNTMWVPYRAMAAGGGDSTVYDMLAFANALEAHRLLDAKHTAQLTTGKIKTRYGGKYAYGFGDHTEDSVRCIGHGGGGPGINGELRICDNGYTIAVLGNLDPPTATRIAHYVSVRLPN